MLIILRILITGALVYVFDQMKEQGSGTHISGDLTQAFYMGIVLVLAILMAAVWAPYLGEKIANPITGEMTCGSYSLHRRWLPRMIQWFDTHRWKRMALICCILEGLDNPDFQVPFITGLRQTRPGSWWEKVFALEVFRFSNAQNSLKAADILRDRHQIVLNEHDQASIMMALRKRERIAAPPRTPKPLPKAPLTEKPKRNQRIRLFTDKLKSKSVSPESQPTKAIQNNLESPSSVR
jgi:hypothetical protein